MPGPSAYTDLIVGIWVRNDDNAPMNKVVGGDLPAQIWHDFLSHAARSSPRASPLPLPFSRRSRP